MQDQGPCRAPHGRRCLVKASTSEPLHRRLAPTRRTGRGEGLTPFHADLGVSSGFEPPTPCTPCRCATRLLEQIENLIQGTEQAGTRLTCTFACPMSGKTVTGRADIVKANGSMATKAKTKLRASAIKSMTRSVKSSLRGVLGNNVFGKLAGEMVNDKAKEVSAQGGYSEDEMQCATLAAFETVRRQFSWNEATCSFVHASVAG